jgi:hypothetical protein
VNQIDLTEKEQKIAQLLINFMQNNPEAKHTAEGIARWWILQQKLEDELEVIEKVIECLTDEGIIEKIEFSDGDAYYRYKPDKSKINQVKLFMKMNDQK